MIAAVLAIHFNATDSHRMQEIGYLLILVAGVLLTVGSGIPLGGRGSRSLAGVALIIAGALLFAAVRWGTL
jgi:drug/metabolite transporter (DMT)-like permease